MSAVSRAETGLDRARRIDPTGYLAVAFAVAVVAIVVYVPVLAFPALGVSTAVLVLNVGSRLPRFFLGGLMALLIGYAFLGRGLAHIGVPPVYAGEILLASGVLTVLVRLGRLTFGPMEWLIVAFMLWGAARTLPFYCDNGTDALRDAALWGYAVFALAIPVALRGEDRTRTILDTYRAWLPLFLLWVPLIGVVASGVDFPAGPGSEVSIVSFKGGDMGVHLGAAAAFLALGLYSESPGWRLPSLLLWATWLSGVVVVGGLNRGGFIAAALAALVSVAFRPSARAVQFAGVVGFIVLLAAIVNVRLDLGDSGKHISVDEMSRRVTSVFGNEDAALEGTRTFRLEWWGEIVDYTFGGQYFWGGKGFGVNLATDDGFQFQADESLRAPHNSHMTVLARMGVPGFAMWVALQVAFAASLLYTMRRAQRADLTRWASIDAWLLIYWLAICVNAAFDPYLEGPQGGIWYWSIIGTGLYVLRLQHAELREIERDRWRSEAAQERIRARPVTSLSERRT